MNNSTGIVLLTCILMCLAIREGNSASLPDAKLTVKVVSEDSLSLSNMPVHVWLSEKVIQDGKTDSNGAFIAEGTCSIKDVPIRIVSDGYYESSAVYSFPNYLSVKDGKWQPWNPTVTVVVRRIVNPIPMYAKCVETAIPTTNTSFGFDLMTGDWVHPVGRGVVSDLIFSVDGVWRNYRDNDSTLILTFAQANDGLVVAKHDVLDRRPTGSVFILPRYAPVEGYVNVGKWRHMRRKLGGSAQDQLIDEVNVEGRHYIFRVRSQTNEAGVVTNACYGKFHGNIEYVGAAQHAKGSWLKFTYYLNPTPNDRNLEFDPKRNLFKDLESTEQVTQP